MRANSKPREELGLTLIVDGPHQASQKLWVSFSKQDTAMTTISRRITKIVSDRRLPEIMIKRRRSKNGFTTPFDIYGS